MLQTKTVTAETLSLLNRLMLITELHTFDLVGGTALALQYGHRLSIDLDLFSVEEIKHDITIKALQKEFGENFQYDGAYNQFGIFCYINNIKTDIVHYPHSLILQPIIDDGVRMYHPLEIAAMKIQAILGRGKKKDFWDLYLLLQQFSLEQIIEVHAQKFPSQQLFISIPQAITYFADAQEDQDPVSLQGQTWQSVKKLIQKKVSDYLR